MLKALFAQLAALASLYANTVRAGMVFVRKAICIVDVGTLKLVDTPRGMLLLSVCLLAKYVNSQPMSIS